MSTSFVHRGGRGFWCPDWLLEVLAAHAGAALRGDPDLAHVGEAWAGLARARILGCLDLGLDELPAERASRVAEVVDGLRAIPLERLEAATLNGMDLGTWFETAVERAHWERACAATVAVLEGGWPHGVADEGARAQDWLYGGGG